MVGVNPLIALLLTPLPAYPRTIRLPRMRCARRSLWSLSLTSLTTLPAYPRITRLPRMRFVSCSLWSLSLNPLTTLPTYPRITRLPRMRFVSFLPLCSRSRVACVSRSRQAKTQQEPTRHETNDFGSIDHDSLLG
jgi:hypothetical protein